MASLLTVSLVKCCSLIYSMLNFFFTMVYFPVRGCCYDFDVSCKKGITFSLYVKLLIVYSLNVLVVEQGNINVLKNHCKR